tara:strand:+ start:843 stop:1151 length:309 start_codon:yes stop_codon:yes gene_type:complete
MWKKILKLDMEEARRLGDRYAPEDMAAARKEKSESLQGQLKPVILRTLKMYMKERDEKNIRRFRDSMASLLREFPDAPRLVRSTIGEAKIVNQQKILDYFGE